ncbi:MAG: hypothetical protein IT373_31145 [Polyangiaceae bacterium]|nr:hypothetical protein [Polyangiaceae bacterium]
MAGCTVGQGEGWVTSDRLYVAECWNGAYDLRPDFFAASPFRDTMQIRVQRGSDLAEVSDGVSVLVNEVSTIRASLLGTPITVGLPPGLVAGDPTQEPPLVSLALYLQLSCHNQNAVVYALGGQIVFEELFDGDPNEKSAAEKLTVATFEVDVADPHDAAPGTIDVPDDKRSHLSGYFRFFFERGRPGQPFP